MPQTILGFPAMNVLLVAAVGVIAYLLFGSKRTAGTTPEARFIPPARDAINAAEVEQREKAVGALAADLAKTAATHLPK